MTKIKSLSAKLKTVVSGDVLAGSAVRKKYSHDASLFEVKPEVVVFPKDTEDIKNLVKFVSENKKDNPSLSLTGRSAGTDMSGGSINDSIIVAFERYINNMGEVSGHEVSAQPGVFYRDFEKRTIAKNLLMPSYPASRELCMIGGIVSNDSGGEKSLKYGKTHKYVTEVKMVLRDGKEYTFKKLDKKELDKKIKQKDMEGRIYKRVYELVKKNQKLIKQSKPNVSKNSAGYNLWDVWDGKTFDMPKLLVGSQGTLGLLTEAKFKLVVAKPLSGMVVAFLPDLKELGQLINVILPLKPSSLESFDEHTLKFAIRFFISFRKTLGFKKFVLLGLSFIPLISKLLHYITHLPKLIVLIEFEGDSQKEIDDKIYQTVQSLDKFDVETYIAHDKKHEEKFWVMRRESFNLLRKNVKKKHTAPFIDDLVVPPKHLPEFMPRLTDILERYELLYTIAGHVGDGNFHIIPLMDLSDPKEREKIPAVLNEVTTLILEYNGSLTGEHNDGMIRGPFLEKMYGSKMLELFREVKVIFDPDHIFNPHKKAFASLEYSNEHVRRRF